MEKTEHIRWKHNVSLLMYHFVCPTKYRRVVIDEEIDSYIKVLCLEIEIRYDIYFLEIWVDKDHVHFLVQWKPEQSPTSIVRTIKSIIWKRVFKTYPRIKEELWWWSFWSSGYYVNTVWRYWNEEVIRRYVKNQWQEKEYKQLYRWVINENQLILY
jgi:REP element-mobilizing transposase RayT